MFTLARHLWDQLLHDEEAAKIRISAAKTAIVGFLGGLASSIMALCKADFTAVVTWTRKDWLAAASAAAATSVIAAAASAKDKAGSPKPQAAQP